MGANHGTFQVQSYNYKTAKFDTTYTTHNKVFAISKATRDLQPANCRRVVQVHDNGTTTVVASYPPKG